MHVIIANGIAEKLSIHDKTSFLLGAVAPDAVHSKKEKGTSHFYAGTTKNYTRRIDYDSFFHKYESHINSPFILGYYTHLIADDNWLSGFFLPWLKNRIENDETIAPLYYNDFKLLNAKLLHHYDQEQQLFSLLNQEAHIVDIEEVSKENVLAFRKYLFEDMLYPKTYKYLRLTKSLAILRQRLKKEYFLLNNSLMKNPLQKFNPPQIYLRGIFT